MCHLLNCYIFVDEVLGLKNSYAQNGIEQNKTVNSVKASGDSHIECKHVTEVSARITDAVSRINSSAATTINLSVVQEVTIVKQDNKTDDRVDSEVDDNTEDYLSTKLTQVLE